MEVVSRAVRQNLSFRPYDIFKISLLASSAFWEGP